MKKTTFSTFVVIGIASRSKAQNAGEMVSEATLRWCAGSAAK